MPFLVAAHGGALSEKSWQDGVQAGCDAAVRHFGRHSNLLDAAVACVEVLEDDGRFNAGRGAVCKLDGRTIEMDAACMTGDDRFGAVACIQEVRHPIQAALAVHATPHNLVVGQGATDLARTLGLERGARTTTKGAKELESAATAEGKLMGEPVSIHKLLRLWNYPTDMPEGLEACDTVGAVATDGRRFAAAASTGGLQVALRGRASDLAAPGGGIFAGPMAAVACTGNGEIIGRHQAARRIHDLIAQGVEPDTAIHAVAELMPGHIGFGAVCVTRDEAYAYTNRDMPWAKARGAAGHKA